MDWSTNEYRADTVRVREAILSETRAFMDAHGIPADRREEYCLVGIPVSTTYRLLNRERNHYPVLVEHYDPETRYFYPKGFGWWSAKLYDFSRGVRAYPGYDYQPAAES